MRNLERNPGLLVFMQAGANEDGFHPHQFGRNDILVYSVHTMTYPNPVAYRDAQIAAVVEDIGDGGMPVIAGGDFNTVSGRSIQRMIDQFSAIGLTRTSSGSGPTIVKLGVRPSATDHIFTRGFTKIASGKVEDTSASDHFPVWVQVAEEEPEGE